MRGALYSNFDNIYGHDKALQQALAKGHLYPE
jgi:hypothetical protein